MADLAVTVAEVLFVSGTKETAFAAGETITAGMSVYLKSTDSKWYKAQKDGTAEESGSGVQFGIALHAALAGQPLTVQVGGVITIGATAAPTVGETYIISAAAGGIAPIGDISTHKLTYLAYCSAAGTLTMFKNATNITHA